MVLWAWLTTASARTYGEADLRALLRSLAPHVEAVAGRSFEELPPLTIDDREHGLAAEAAEADRIATALGIPPEEREPPPELHPRYIAVYAPTTGSVWVISDAMQQAFAEGSVSSNEDLLAHALAHELVHALVDQQISRADREETDEELAIEEGYAEWVAERVVARRTGQQAVGHVQEALASNPSDELSYRYHHGYVFVSAWIDTYGPEAAWSLLASGSPTRDDFLAVAAAQRRTLQFDDPALLAGLALLSPGGPAPTTPLDIAWFAGLDPRLPYGRSACRRSRGQDACVGIASLPSPEMARQGLTNRSGLDGARVGLLPGGVRTSGVDAGSLPGHTHLVDLGVQQLAEGRIVPILALPDTVPQGHTDTRDVTAEYAGAADAAMELTFSTGNGRYREVYAYRGGKVAVISTVGRANEAVSDALAHLLSGEVARRTTDEEVATATRLALARLPGPGSPPPVPERGAVAWRTRAALHAFGRGDEATCLGLAGSALPDALPADHPRLASLAFACSRSSDDLSLLVARLVREGDQGTARGLLEVAEFGLYAGAPDPAASVARAVAPHLPEGSADHRSAQVILAAAEDDLPTLNRLLRASDLLPEASLAAALRLWWAGQDARARALARETCVRAPTLQGQCARILKEMGG